MDARIALASGRPLRGCAGLVLCPSEGPLVIDHFAGDRFFLLERDGSFSGTVTETPMRRFAFNSYSVPCTEAGREAVCATDAGVLFIGRDGTTRESDQIEGLSISSDGSGCDVAYTGAGVALVWGRNSLDETYLFYAFFDPDGGLVVPPVASDPIIGDPCGIHAASSGSTVFVVTGGPRDTFPETAAHLLDLSGASLCPPAQVSSRSHEFGRGMAVFWEGDAYSALWNPWPLEVVAYRRFLVISS
jgi:hypothetical protein